jgi:hypothetical protein
MNPVSSEHPTFTPAAAARAGLSLLGESSRTRLNFWPIVAILTAFWIYVMLTNVLYARSMSIALDPGGTKCFYAAWDARVMQHVLLYPALLGCMWGSLRIGWRPGYLAVPAQLLLALFFSMLAGPALWGSEALLGHECPAMHMPAQSAKDQMQSRKDEEQASRDQSPGAAMKEKMHDQPWTLRSMIMDEGATWVASITNFELTYGFALALVMGFSLYQRFKDSELRREALERAWSGARLAALRLQLSPHTLFNLLHTIRGQIAWDPATAQSMVVQLGDLLRRLLAAGEREFSRLSDELQFVRLYLELQQRRFADRMSLSLPDPAKLPAAWVPSLILQPLVENAVAHGLAEHSGAVLIKVEITTTRDTLIVRIVNTTAMERSRSGGGIGLRNVRERLAVHFGERATFNAGLTAMDEWSAEICMPLLLEGAYSPQAADGAPDRVPAGRAVPG